MGKWHSADHKKKILPVCERGGETSEEKGGQQSRSCYVEKTLWAGWQVSACAQKDHYVRGDVDSSSPVVSALAPGLQGV